MADSEVGLRLSLKNRRETSRGLKDTAREVSQVGDAAGKASTKSDRLGSSFGRLGSGLGMLARGAGIVGGAIVAATGAVGVFGVKSAASLETATMNLTTLTGSAKTAGVMVKQLTAYGNATTFDTGNLTAAAQQMLTFGIATKDVMPYMKMLGDIAMGNSTKLSGLAYVFAQVQGAGRLMGGDLNQMINQGFNPLIYISKRTGRSIGDLRKEMSKGEISFDMVKQAMVDATKKGGQFYQGAKNGAKTLSGAWGNLTGTIESTLGTAFLPVIKAAEGPINKLGNLVQAHQKDIRRGVSATLGFVKGALAKAGEFVRPVIDGISHLVSSFRKGGGASSQFAKTWAALKSFIMPLVPVVKDFGRQAIAVLQPALADIGRIITTKVLPAFQAFLPAVQPIAKFLLQVLGGAVLGVLKGAVNVIKGVLKVIAGVFNVFAGLLTGDWGRLWQGIKDIATGLLQGIWGAIQVWWNLGILSIFKKGILFLTKGLWKGLWSGLKTGAVKGFGLINRGIGAGLKLVGKLILGGIKGYLGLWKNLFVGAWKIASTGWKVLRSAFGGALAAIRTVVSDVFTAIWSRITGAMSKIIGTVRGAIGNVVGFFGSLRTNLLTIMAKIVDGISAGVGKITGFFKGIGGKIKSATSGMFNGVRDAFKGAINWIIDHWNAFHLTIGGGSILGKTLPSITLNTPDIPRLAHGGPVQAGHPYIVGDRGPRSAWELFMPSTDGYVHPHVPNDFDLEHSDISVGPKWPGGPITVQFVVDRKVITEAVLDGVDDKAARR